MNEPATIVQPAEIFGLIPQIQPTSRTCVQTCLAIALGVPVSDVIARYGDEPMNQQSLTNALTECRVLWNQLVFGTVFISCWHFAVVPSLNHRGGNHQVLLHWSEKGFTVIDPAIGERYKMDGSDLLSWEQLTPFMPGGRLPKKV